MDIDLSVLKFIEREKEIPFNELVSIIEAAILAAYQKHVGNSDPARAELSKSTGHVNIYAPVLDEEGVKEIRAAFDSHATFKVMLGKKIIVNGDEND